jgi:hypothetical protein
VDLLAPEVVLFFEDASKVLVCEGRNGACKPINLRRYIASGPSKSSEYVLASQKITWRIETVTNPSDQVSAVMGLPGAPPVSFPPAVCLRISVLHWIMLIGIVAE